MTAAQPGDATWAAAPSVQRAFAVLAERRAQSISFPALPDTALSAGQVQLGASASSGLPVTYASQTPEVCRVDGGSVTLVAVGTCRVVATQSGDGAWLPAAEQVQAFTVLPGQQSISFPALSDTALSAAPPTLSASATSGLLVTYTAGPRRCARSPVLPCRWSRRAPAR